MTINDKIKDEKLRNNVNREAVKISTLSSEKKKKKDKYEYFTVKKYYHLIKEEW